MALFLPEIPPPTEPSKSSPKKGESHKESETQPPSKQDKLILSRIPKQSDIVEDKKTSGKASGDLTSGVSKLPTRDQRSPSKQKPRNESSPDSSNQEPNGKTQIKTVVGASGIATADHVKDVATRSVSAKNGEDQAKMQSRENDIKLKEQDTTKSEAATTKSPLTEETSHIPPIQSNDKKTKESSKLTVTTVKSDILPSEVGKESPSDSPSVGLSMSVKPGRQVETEQPAKAESPTDDTAEIQNKSTKLEQEKVQQTTIGPKDSTERDITERSELGGGLKPEEKVSVDPAWRDQGTEHVPVEKRTKPVEKSLQKSDRVTSDQKKVLPTVLASEVKCVEPEDAAPASPVTYSVDPELANKASEPKKLLTVKNIIPTVGELPSFTSSLTDPKVEEKCSKEAGSSIQTEAVTVLAKNVGNQVDKEVLIVAGQQRDLNERLSDPAVGNTDSLNSCREEPKSIIMQDGAEGKASKPGKPVTLLKSDSAEQTQAAGTDAQQEKNVTMVIEKEQVTNKPSALETKSESNISVEKKAKVIVEKTEKQIKAIAENNKKEPKELQTRNEEITITESNLKEMIIVNQTPEPKDLTNVNVRIKEGNNKEISNRTADIEVLKDQVSSIAIVNGTEINKAVEDTSLSAISKGLSANLDMQTKAVKVEKKSLENQVPQIDASQGTDDTKRARVTEEERKTKESSMKDSVINAENIVQPTVIGKDNGPVRDKLKPDTQTGQRQEPKIKVKGQVNVNGPVEMVKSGNTEKKNDDNSKLLTKEEQVKDNKVKEYTGTVVQEGEIPEPKPFAVNTQGDEGLGKTKDTKTISENKTVDKQVSLNTVTTTVPDENKNKAMSFANESANTTESCKAKVQQTAGVLGNQNKDGTEVDKHRTPKAKVENILENQKPLIQNKVNLQDSSKQTTPEAKMAGRDDRQQVKQSKNNLEEKIKTEMKESKELADSPKESRVLINDKTTREMDKKQKELAQDVPEVKIKQAKPDDQKKSIKEGENKIVKMPNHADAQEDGGNTKAPTKTSIGLKTQQLLQTKDGASNLGDPQMLNVSDFLRAHGKKSATQNLQLSKESPSSWLDVEHQPKKKKESRRILDTSTSEDESLEPDDLDEFVRSIREGSTPFTQPLKKHTRKKTPSPAMPAIKEDNFDPDSFQFGLRKKDSIFKDPSPAMMIKQNSANRKGRVQENASRDQAEARVKSPDGVDGKTGVQGGTDAGKEEPPVNGEEAGKLSSRLQRISILSSLMSSPWSSRKVREEVASAKDSAAPPSGGKAGATSPPPPPLEADKQGVDKGKSQSPAGAGLSALSELAGGPASPPAVPSFSEVKLPAHLEKYVKKSKSETETTQAPKQPPQTKPSPKGSGGKGKASMAGAPNASSSNSSVNGLSTSKHKVRPEL